MVSESWFRSLLKPRKHEDGLQKVVIGVLAFEVAGLMSKMVYLWQSLSDKRVTKLREDIKSSLGVKKLVSDDDEYIGRLICAEMIESLTHVAKAVSRLGKKCNDPSLRGFEHFYNDLIQIGADPYGWIFTWKKMERKVKKMERFIAVNANLYQETEILSDLERTLRRMKGNDDLDGVNLLEFKKKVLRKQVDVRHLRELSLWNRSYDYTVLILVQSLFTIFSRIKHVFGIEQIIDTAEMNDTSVMNSDYMPRSQSVSLLRQALFHPLDNGLARFASGPLRRLTAKSGMLSKTNKTNNLNSYSGPLNGSITMSGPISGPTSGNDIRVNFHSGPLGKSATKQRPISGIDKTSKKMWLPNGLSLNVNGKKPNLKPNKSTQVGPLKGCIISSSPVANCYISSNGFHSETLNGARESDAQLINPHHKAGLRSSILNSKSRLLDAPPETLGTAALALHYANVIIVIEKLAASPHLIGLDARDDLYNMLPANVRAALRARLKPFTKNLGSSVYDTVLAEEWSEAMTGILEWLAPLAHNMIRWQSERSFEQQSLGSRTNVLLVQTLYFANQEKTEAIITELLVGLNYIWRFGREINAKALLECATASSRIYDEYLDLDG